MKVKPELTTVFIYATLIGSSDNVASEAVVADNTVRVKPNLDNIVPLSVQHKENQSFQGKFGLNHPKHQKREQKNGDAPHNIRLGRRG